MERHKFTENRDPARPRATFGADCLTCNEGMMHPNHDPVPEAPPAKDSFAGVAEDLAQAIRDAQSLDDLTWKWTLDTMDHHLRSDCRICGDRVYSLDDHLRSHERPAAGDEDARGGAPRP